MKIIKELGIVGKLRWIRMVFSNFFLFVNMKAPNKSSIDQSKSTTQPKGLNMVCCLKIVTEKLTKDKENVTILGATAHLKIE
jgi:hypothetical protein